MLHLIHLGFSRYISCSTEAGHELCSTVVTPRPRQRGSHGRGTGCAAPSADCSFSSQRILCSNPMTCTARTKECHHNKGRCSGLPPLAKVPGNGRSRRSPFCLHTAVHHLMPTSLSASSHDVGMLHHGVDVSCAARSDATTGCAALLVLPCCNRRARSRIDERKMRNMIYEPKAASHSSKTPPLHLLIPVSNCCSSSRKKPRPEDFKPMRPRTSNNAMQSLKFCMGESGRNSGDTLLCFALLCFCVHEQHRTH